MPTERDYSAEHRRRSPQSRDYLARVNAARQRARSRLAQRYPLEFKQLLDEEMGTAHRDGRVSDG